MALERLRSRLMEAVVRRRGARVERDVVRATRAVEATQAEVLRRILAAQAGTEYGRRHGFAAIRSVADFRARVPVNEYEDLRPWIEKQDTTGALAINREMPVCYAVTSGTTGQPKYVPVLRSTLRSHQRIQDLFLLHLLAERPRVLRGRVLAIVSPAVEDFSPGARLPCGSTSGQMYESIPRLVQSRYVVPAPVFGIEDYDTKYLMILRLALRHRDVSYLTTANPSTLARLIGLARSHWDRLVADVAEGGFHRNDELTPSQRRAVAGRLRPDPARAAELEAIRRREGTVRIRHLWPELQAVGVWTGGSSRIFLEQLEGEFSRETLVRDIGYLASEVRGTVPIHSGTAAGLPTFLDHFFEFSPRERWDAGERSFLGLHELEDGQQYYVFVTTDAGLYRYHMNDVVEVDGAAGQAPRLRFVQKGRGVTNISGEKLTESQVISAVTEVEAEYGLTSSFYLAAADELDSRYVLYFEPAPLCPLVDGFPEDLLAKSLDQALARSNLEYAAKRRSGRLRAPRVARLRRGAFEAYKRSCLARGQREGQFKIVALQYRRDLAFDFDRESVPPEDEPHPLAPTP